MARGSATECAAVLDVLRIRGLAEPQQCRRGRSLVLRVVQTFPSSHEISLRSRLRTVSALVLE